MSSLVHESLHVLQFVLGQQTRMPFVKTEFDAQSIDRIVIISRQHDGVDAHLSKRIDCSFRRGARLIVGHGERSFCTTVHAVLHGDYTCGECASFVEHHSVYMRHGIEVQSSLKQDAALRGSSDTGKITQRDAQHQGARARSHEEDEGTIYPIAQNNVGKGEQPLR